MQVRVRAVGVSLEQMMRDTRRDLRAANRKVGREVGTVGRAAIRKGAPRMWGRQLAAKTKVDSWPDRAVVSFQASPAGGWAMRESGTRRHPIDPGTRKALAFDGRFAAHVDHPGSSGERAWTKAGERLADAIEPAITDIYDDALGA